MLNQIVLVGRLTSDLEIKEVGEKKVCFITLAVPRSFKNSEGEYETDFIPCTLWGGIAENTAEWCEKGDLIGIKGRIQGADGKIEIIAEKVTFLSANKGEK
jgi:single-strand DNA-binding protein